MRELNVEEIREILEMPVDQRPKGYELRIGFTLLAWRERKAYPSPYRTLRDFAMKEFPRREASDGRMTDEGLHTVSYPTLVRWVNVARMLSALDEKYREWDLSKLVELLSLPKQEQRERYLSEYTDERFEAMGVRELRASLRQFHERSSRVAAEQLVGVTDRVVERHLLHEHREWLDLVRVVRGDEEMQSVYGLNVDYSDADAVPAAKLAASVIALLENHRSKWRQTPKPRRRPREWADVLAADYAIRDSEVPEEQLVLAWSDGEEFVLRETGSNLRWMLRLVRRVPLADWITLEREDHVGELACLVDTRSGSRDDLDAIIRPTPWQGNLTMQFPLDHGPRLYEYRSPDAGTPQLWQISPEGPDGSAVLALGLLQTLAEANPEMAFTTTCSHHVHVPDLMLDWLASLGNAWVQHVLCGKLDDEENVRRLDQLRRFRDFGVPTVALIVSGKDWPNSQLRKRAAHLLEQVEPILQGGIIERPYPSPDALLADGRRTSRRPARPSQDTLIEEEGTHPAEIGLPICGRGSSCRGCQTLCGYHLLRRLGKLSFSRLPLT